MERLTRWIDDGEERQAIPEPTIRKNGHRKCCNKLAKYEDAEEQGEILRLPINEDTPVYSIEYCCGNDKSNRMGMCFRGSCENCGNKAYYIRESVAKYCSICEINKSVFLTREEAEAKLKEMEENHGE